MTDVVFFFALGVSKESSIGKIFFCRISYCERSKLGFRRTVFCLQTRERERERERKKENYKGSLKYPKRINATFFSSEKKTFNCFTFSIPKPKFETIEWSIDHYSLIPSFENLSDNHKIHISNGVLFLFLKMPMLRRLWAEECWWLEYYVSGVALPLKPNLLKFSDICLQSSNLV